MRVPLPGRPAAAAALLLVLAATPLRAASPAGCQPAALPSFDVTGKTGWNHVSLSRLKRDTQYSTAQSGGQTVLHAQASGAASAYVHLLAAPASAAAAPVLQWRWRTDALIADADNSDAKREDAPLRVIVGFDGDKSKLSEQEQRRFARAKKLSGRDMPYATLMYIWENRQPVGSVIASAHTTRLKMVVVESGAQGVGGWRDYRRNLLQDYQRAFGEKPGRVLGVAVMTDTDNTGAQATGLYGPLQLACE